MWRISSLGRTKSDIGGLEGCGEDMMRDGCLLRGWLLYRFSEAGSGPPRALAGL